MSNKVKISFVLPEALQQDLKKMVIKDGYDLKGKSKWVSEAIERLLKMENFTHLVKLNDEMSGFEKMESIVVENALKLKINESTLIVRKDYPILEGVQSRILRTAIVQRLIG